MAEKCGKCCNLDWKNKSRYSSREEFYCKERRKYVEPTDYCCSYFMENKSISSSGGYQQSGCFLTTACMKFLQDKFDDNCYELTVLRWFRDNFVSKEDINHYYEVAPIIVDALDSNPQGDIAYNYIYDNVVDKCVCDIENGRYEEAYTTYKNTVLLLEESFAKPYLEQNLVNVLSLKKAI